MIKITKTPVFYASVAASLALAFFPIFFQWDRISIKTLWSIFSGNSLDLWSSFMLLLLFGGYFVLLLLLYLLILIWSSLFSVLKIKKYGTRAVFPLFLNLLVLVMFVPFSDTTIDDDYYKNLTSRVSVVEKIKTGELVANMSYNSGLIHLSFWYPLLSKGGNDILVEDGDDGKQKVLFFTYRGVVDNFAGIVFKEDNLPPNDDDFGCGTLLESKKFQDNWFWMSCT